VRKQNFLGFTGLEIAKKSQRLLAVDAIRVIAIVLMIQGHTLDALLDASQYQSHAWYGIWLFCRGLTAPAFMMMSGFSFVLATTRHWDRHIALSPTVLRRIRRFCFFILLGYTMHFPVHRLTELVGMSHEDWLAWAQVDVLQAIGVSLLLLQALVFLARTPRRFIFACVGSLSVVLVAAPLLWSSVLAGHLPVGVAAYVDGSTGSLFPLLPWSAYVLFGAALGSIYARVSKFSPASFSRAILYSGLLMTCFGLFVQPHALQFYGDTVFWHTSPTLFLVRAGIVLSILATTMLVFGPERSSPRSLQAIAAESLLIYAIHVCVLYGSIWNPGLRQVFGRPLDLSDAAMCAGFLIVSMLAGGFFWNRIKTAGPQKAPIAVRACVFAAAVWSVV
jgi:uncharacterized membrane protein